jgi:hypothetical protein
MSKQTAGQSVSQSVSESVSKSAAPFFILLEPPLSDRAHSQMRRWRKKRREATASSSNETEAAHGLERKEREREREEEGGGTKRTSNRHACRLLLLGWQAPGTRHQEG